MKKTLLTPEEFDAIHIGALAFGGIGRGRLEEMHDGQRVPVCALGMLKAAKLLKGGDSPFRFTDSDMVVWRLKGKRDRITFSRWVKAMHVDITEE